MRRAARLAGRVLASLAAAATLWVLAYRFVDPPTTPLIEAERARLGAVRRAPVRLSTLPPHVPLAFLAAEDARFCDHWGIDWTAVRAAWRDNARGGRLRGGSTITQQTAKNAFLWPARSWARKALEAGFALLIEPLWPKRRILEVYLNIAETGPGLFGIEAAAQAWFGRPAARLTPRQAALIAAALPAPRDRDPTRPSPFMQRRAAAIAAGAADLAQTGCGACALP
ncbi:monofunctional biosynthetic peptidoglycan transglycosylase [Oceanicella actignis]|uniref:monofunctional biosynthetic peptidoglycan transglycosylase n=1 Tax=Oceanicella actignis TaxID=1189325 RepID=UPI0011E6A21B|nr:monofunctional biosynthetic peptidoglycan transglycosylase [Oceanicella actignis]TYO88611.1 monofunctional biosynthetic peptidoglycan transglycosylase [Oceanicella actignis]